MKQKRLNKIWLLLVACLLPLSIQAQFDASKTYTIVNNNDATKYMQDNSTGGVALAAKNDNSYWKFVATGNADCYYIQNATTGKYIQGYTATEQEVATGESGVEFYVKADANGSYAGKYRMAVTSLTPYDFSGGTLGLNWKNNNTVQSFASVAGGNPRSAWVVTEAAMPEPSLVVVANFDSSKTYSIESNNNAGKYMQDNGDGYIVPAAMNNNSYWQFEATANAGCYYVKNVATGKYMQKTSEYEVSVKTGDEPVEIYIVNDPAKGEYVFGMASTDRDPHDFANDNTYGANYNSDGYVQGFSAMLGGRPNSFWKIVEAAIPGTELADIAALKAFTPATDEEDVVLTLTDAKVTFVTSKEMTDYDENWNEITVTVDQVVVEDASGATMLEGTGLGAAVKAGDTLNGELPLTVASGWGTTTTAPNAYTEGSIAALDIVAGTAEPTVINNDEALEAWAADPEWRYVKFENVPIKIVSGTYGDEMQLDLSDYTGNKIGIMDNYGLLTEYPADGAVVNFTGFYTYYLGMMEIMIPVKLEIRQSVDVAISDALYSTFVAPFDATMPEGVTANTATLNGETVELTPITGAVPAHTPVILSATAAKNFTVNGYPTAAPAELKNGVLVGTYEEITAPDGSYVLQKQSGKVGFYVVDQTVASPKVKANRAYLEAPTNGVKAYFFDNADAIEAVETKAGDAVIYNLAGQRMSNAQKGVNIINGKKVIVK